MLEDCIYCCREDGIHEFIFHVPSQDAVNFWLEKINIIRNKNGTVGLMLMDVRSFTPPAMYYMVQKFRAWRKDYPRGTGSRTAVVFPEKEGFISVAHTFAQLMISGRYASVQLFKRSDYEQALIWLQEKE